MSYVFNGSGNYLRAGFAGLLTAYPYTFACWVKIASALDVQRIAMSMADEATQSHVVCFGGNGTNHVLGYSYVSGSVVGVTESSGSIPTGAWVHLAFVCHSATSRYVYLNGTASAEQTQASAFITGADNLCLGAYRWQYEEYGSAWLGRIAEASVWSTGLSGANITALKDGAAATTISTGLVAYWPLLDDLADDVGSRTMAQVGTVTSDADHPTVSAGGGGGAVWVPHILLIE